jgi:predicted ATPase/DNA-binding winged helix-turn-helix (wHTH) protein
MPTDQRDLPGATRVLFGPFELNIAERTLRRAGEEIPLGARAFDILVALVDRPGEVVGKNALIASAWPDVTVEEGSLRVHLSALRKALSDGQFGSSYIANVQGRGYSFVAPVVRQEAEGHKARPVARSSSLPTAPGRMIGRDHVVRQIRTRLRTERLITIMGAGGIGKTTVALAVGHAALDDFSGAVVFVDLSVLRSKDQVVAAMASTMGLALPPGDPEGALLEFLRSRRALLILDSCEHLIEQMAEIADRICRYAPDVCLLATSREALQVAGESVYRLQRLSCPPELPGQTVEEILSYPAARLFIERVGARGVDLVLRADDAVLVAEICRRLDGIPLALELAARRAATFGVRDTAARLASHVGLQTLTRRTANPRHQTLGATLDWSHDLLSEVERAVLRRVAIFIGSFTLEAALAVAEHEDAGRCDVVDAVGSLVEKSLIASRIDTHEASYRLLDTTRFYALEKLAASGEHDAIATRHAIYSAELLEANSADFFEVGIPKDTRRLKDYLGNARAAIEWSFGPGGSYELAIRLAAAAGPLFLAMSLLTECREWMAKAVDRLDVARSDARREMIIQSALASCMMFTEGMTDESYSAWEKSRYLADSLKDAEHELVCLLVLWAHQVRIPNYGEATRLADDCGDLAERTGDRGAIATANYMRGVTYHHTGRLSEAEAHLELSLARDGEATRQALIKRFGYDRKADALSVLANLKWLRGCPDRARRLNRMAIAEARQFDQAVPLCVALTWASFNMYLMSPDDGETVSLVDELLELAGKHDVQSYHGFGLSMQALCRTRQGEPEAGRELLYTGLEKLSVSRYGVFNCFFQAEFARCLAGIGRAREGLETFENAQIRLEGSEWYAPELHRIRGELALSNDQGLAASRECFVHSLELSARQESLSWALRAATSLALAERSAAGRKAALGTLRAIHAKFREGLDTTDLRLAAKVLSG